MDNKCSKCHKPISAEESIYSTREYGKPFCRNHRKKYNPTEGEEFIREYLENKGVQLEEQVVTPQLKGDDKGFRVIDFYLPDYDVYIEFFGNWDHQERKAEYRRKRDVYEKNDIFCMYFYPDNLGILDFIFKKRLLELLKRKNSKRLLLKYTIYILLLDTLKWQVVGLFALIYLLLTKQWSTSDKVVLGFFSIAIGFHILQEIFYVWKKEKKPNRSSTIHKGFIAIL